jgi:hypothetical protein
LKDSDVFPQLLAAAESSLQAAQETAEKRNGRVVGFALVSDDSACSFVSFAAISSETDVDSEPTFLFNPDNWNWSRNNAETPEGDIVEDFYEACEDYDNDAHWHERYRERFYSILVSVLEALRLKVSPNESSTFMTVWIVDSDTFETHAKSWTRRLNDANTYNEFVKWHDETVGAV